MKRLLLCLVVCLLFPSAVRAQITSTAPQIRFRETPASAYPLPAGLWRVVLDDNQFRLQKNTDANGLFATYTTPWIVDADGNLTVLGTFTADTFALSGLDADAFLYSGTASAFTTAVATNGQLLIGSTGAAPAVAALTAGSGISVTNGAGTITLANTGVFSLTLGTAGTDLALSGATGAITLNVPTASAANRGALSAANWSTFNAKQAAGNYVTSLTGHVTASGPGAAEATIADGVVTEAKLLLTDLTTGNVSITAHGFVPKAPNDTALFFRGDGTYAAPPGGENPLTFSSPLSRAVDTISIPVATSIANGYLASGDWSTFNAKQAAGNYITSLTGDVTGSGPGAAATTIAVGAVDLAMMADMATASIIGRTTGGAGVPEILSVADVRTLLSITNVEDTALSTWAGSANLATLATAAVSLAEMADMATASIIGRVTGGAGAPEILSVADIRTLLSIINVEDTALSTWAGSANITTLGTISSGSIPESVLSITDNTTGNVSTSAHGFVPKGTDLGYFLKDDGTWAAGGENPLTFSAPLSRAVDTISIPVATSIANGYLASADWSTFNAKQAAGSYITSLTGDVTGSGPGAAATTIAAGAVDLAMMADMATASIIGRKTAGAGVPEILSVADIRTLLSISNVEDTALTTWTGSANLATLATAAVSLAEMADMATASLLGRNTAGTGVPEVLSAATVKSLLAIVEGDIGITDITTGNFSTSAHGFVPKGTDVGNFLKDDGTWAAAGGGGVGNALDTEPMWNNAGTPDGISGFVASATTLTAADGALLATSPWITTGLDDSAGVPILGFTATGSAVNYLQVTNNTAGNDPDLAAVGSDANIDLRLTSKGTGKVWLPLGLLHLGLNGINTISADGASHWLNFSKASGRGFKFSGAAGGWSAGQYSFIIEMTGFAGVAMGGYVDIGPATAQSHAATAATHDLIRLGNNFTHAPTSDATVFSGIRIVPTINMTGTAAGHYEGIRINILETALLGTGHRFFSAGTGGVGAYTEKIGFTNTGAMVQPGVAFAALGDPADGVFIYCTDCTIADPCAASGTGAFAKHMNNVWVCN